MEKLIPAWIDGVLTPVEKLEVHQRGLRHEAVSVFLLCDGKILLQQRAMSKYHTPGLWANTCCTHPNWNELALDCAQRRMQEELGITLIQFELKGRIEYKASVGADLTEHEVVDVFTAYVSEAPKILPNPEEVMAIKWMSLEDLRAEVALSPEQFTPWLKIYVENHAHMIFGDTNAQDFAK